jgi:hypothetical protein
MVIGGNSNREEFFLLGIALRNAIQIVPCMDKFMSKTNERRTRTCVRSGVNVVVEVYCTSSPLGWVMSVRFADTDTLVAGIDIFGENNTNLVTERRSSLHRVKC